MARSIRCLRKKTVLKNRSDLQGKLSVHVWLSVHVFVSCYLLQWNKPEGEAGTDSHCRAWRRSSETDGVQWWVYMENSLSRGSEQTPESTEYLGVFLPGRSLLPPGASLHVAAGKQNRCVAVHATDINSIRRERGPPLLAGLSVLWMAVTWNCIGGNSSGCTLFFIINLCTLSLPTLNLDMRVCVIAQWNLFSPNCMLSSDRKLFSQCTFTLMQKCRCIDYISLLRSSTFQTLCRPED